MTNRGLGSTILTFCFGSVVGAFIATIVIREAVPLRDHFVMILLTSLFGAIIIIALIFWYFRVISICKTTLGLKGGTVISTIMSFLLVSTALLFLIIAGILYAAIA